MCLENKKYFDVRETKNGKGLFARMPIPVNMPLIKIWGKIISFEQTLQLGDCESFCLQTGANSYIATHFPFFLCNHSCSPNCGIRNLTVVSLREISENEELTWDYSTSMLERNWKIACQCGAKNCRKEITDFDLLPLKLQEHYLNAGIVMPFIEVLMTKKASAD